MQPAKVSPTWLQLQMSRIHKLQLKGFVLKTGFLLHSAERVRNPRGSQGLANRFRGVLQAYASHFALTLGVLTSCGWAGPVLRTLQVELGVIPAWIAMLPAAYTNPTCTPAFTLGLRGDLWLKRYTDRTVKGTTFHTCVRLSRTSLGF